MKNGDQVQWEPMSEARNELNRLKNRLRHLKSKLSLRHNTGTDPDDSDVTGLKDTIRETRAAILDIKKQLLEGDDYRNRDDDNDHLMWPPAWLKNPVADSPQNKIPSSIALWKILGHCSFEHGGGIVEVYVLTSGVTRLPDAEEAFSRAEPSGVLYEVERVDLVGDFKMIGLESLDPYERGGGVMESACVDQVFPGENIHPFVVHSLKLCCLIGAGKLVFNGRNEAK